MSLWSCQLPLTSFSKRLIILWLNSVDANECLPRVVCRPKAATDLLRVAYVTLRACATWRRQKSCEHVRDRAGVCPNGNITYTNNLLPCSTIHSATPAKMTRIRTVGKGNERTQSSGDECTNKTKHPEQDADISC